MIREEARASNREVVKATQHTMPPPREVGGPWYVVQEKTKSRDRAQANADEADESSKIAKSVERTRERESTQHQVPATKATETTHDWHYVRQPLHPTEGDSGIDIMDRPPMIVSQEEAKAWRLSIKHRMEDQVRGARVEASTTANTAPPSQHRTEVVRRLATPLEQTPVARAGPSGRAFMDSSNRSDTIWSPGRSATTAVTSAIGLTKMMTLPKKLKKPKNHNVVPVKLFAEWCTTHQVFQLDNVQCVEGDKPMLRSRCHHNYGDSGVWKKKNGETRVTPTAGTDPRRNLTMLTGERARHRESLQQDPQRRGKPSTAHQCLHSDHVDRRHCHVEEG